MNGTCEDFCDYGECNDHGGCECFLWYAGPTCSAHITNGAPEWLTVFFQVVCASLGCPIVIIGVRTLWRRLGTPKGGISLSNTFNGLFVLSMIGMYCWLELIGTFRALCLLAVFQPSC
jgi:hypothetical protein